MTVQRLSPDEIAALPAALPAWAVLPDRLRRQWRFRDFSEAFGFMTRVALAAETINHHPTWSNAWNRLTIELTTDDCGGLSPLDLELARRIDSLSPP
jgi:4a-hydroxytetrahydrobiopterin dehydratase